LEVRSTRTQEIRLYKFDEPEVNIRYTGRSDSMLAADSDPKWQIMREYRLNDISITEYANKGSFTAKWSDRVSYFSVATPDPDQPLNGTMEVSGTFSPSGLKNGGRMTLVTLNTATWTALPALPLSDRNGLSVQNQSGVDIKLNYDNTEPGYVGSRLAPDGERFYDIKDTIIVYGKASAGTPTILIEEIS
jgi:hypothetical protein